MMFELQCFRILLAVLLTVLIGTKNTAAIRYLGCFTEPRGARVFSVSAGSYNPNSLTPVSCSSECLRWGYRYAAATQGRYCFCNNNYPLAAANTADANCNVPCTGDASKTCGGNVGSQAISVYENDVPIRGLQLSVFAPVSGVVPVDSSVQFNITVVDGPSNVAYAMDYGDNAGLTSINDSTMYNHVFSMAGDFTITASANDTSVTTASTVVSVQVPAANITAYCVPIVAARSEFRCNASVLSGTYLQLSVNWNDGLVEQFAISDATWFAAGPGIPQHGSYTNGPAASQIVMRNSEFGSDGFLMRLEYFGKTAGQITFLILQQTCTSGSYCYDVNDCSGTCADGQTVVSLTEIFCPSTSNKRTGGSSCPGVTSRYTGGPAQQYQVVYQYRTTIATGRNVIDVSNDNIPVAKGNVIGYFSSAGIISTNNVVPPGELDDLQYATGSVITTPLVTSAGTPTSFRTLLRAIATRQTDVLFFHSFTVPNTYTVQMNVQNTMLDSGLYPPVAVNVTVIAAIPINDSTIDVSPFLTTNKSELISLLPVSGSNITFLWDFGDGTPRVNTSTPFVYHTFTARGCYFINNTAYNIISSNSSKVVQVCVQDAILGLTVNNSLSASAIPTPFLISMSQGSDYICTLSPGDGTSSSKNYTVLPLVANWTYVYPIEGVFMVNVTCVNSVSMQSVIVQQICAAPITNLRLLRNGAIIGAPFAIIYLIDKGTSPLVFNLTFDGVVIPSSFNNVTLQGSTAELTSLPLGIHTVVVTGINPFGTVTIVVNFTIEAPITNPQAVCPPSTALTNTAMTFQGTVLSGTSVNVTFDFADGSLPYSVARPLADPWPAGLIVSQPHSYASSGVYKATVTVSNNFNSFVFNCTTMVFGKINNITLLSNSPVPMINGVAMVKLWFFSTKMPAVTSLSWNYGDGSASVSSIFDGMTVYEYSYAKEGTFTITANMSNPADRALVQTTAIVAVPVVNMVWVMPVAHPSVNVPFKAGITMDIGNNVKLLWDFGDNSSAVMTSRRGRSAGEPDYANHTYTQLGTYTVTGIAMNGIGNTTIHYVVVVQIPINPSDMTVISSAPAVFPPGSLSFTISMPAGTSAPSATSFYLIAGDGNILPAVALPFNTTPATFTFGYTFSSPGDFAVTLVMSNLASTFNFSISGGTFIPIQGLSGLAVYRPPLPVNGPYLRGKGPQMNNFPLPLNVTANLTFIGTATVYRVNVLNNAGQLISSFNSTVNPIDISLKQTGTYTIEVTVWNPLNSATWNTTVNMVDSVLGASVNVTPVVGDVNIPRTISIGLQSYGPDSCVIVDYGDRSTPDAFGSCSATSGVNVKGSITSKTWTVEHTYTKDNSPYTVFVNASDVIGFCTYPLTVSPALCTARDITTASSSDCSSATISIANHSPYFTDPLIVYISMQFDVSAVIGIQCAVTLTNFKWWTIEAINPKTGLVTSNINITTLRSVNNSALSLPAGFLGYGLYRLTLTVSLGSSGYFVSSESTYILSSPTPIVAYIGPPAMQSMTRGWDTNITLSPITYSYDPDIANSSASQGMTNFIWFCRQVDEQWPTFLNGSMNTTASSAPYTNAQLDGGILNSTSLGGCFRQGPGLIRNTGRGSLTFSARNMRINDTYIFRVIVSKGNRNATAELQVNIVPGDPPSLVIGCIDKLLCFPDVSRTIVNPNNRISLFASCSASDGAKCSADITYQWTIYRLGLNEAWLPITNCTRYTTGLYGCSSQEIAISDQLFRDGITLYKGLVNYRLGMVAQASGGTAGVAFIELLVNSPPQGGTCSVTPTTGTSSNTKFTVSCSGWTDSNGIKRYEFLTTQGDGTTAQLGSNVEGILGPFTLSAGLQSSNYGINITVRIFDNLDSFNDSTILPVTVNPISASDAQAMVSNFLTSTTSGNSLQLAVANGDLSSNNLLFQSLADMLNQAAKYSMSDVTANLGNNVTATNLLDNADYQETRDGHAALRSLMISSLTNATVTTMPAIQQTSSSLAALTSTPTELTRDAQVNVMKSVSEMVNTMKTLSATTPIEELTTAAASIFTAIGNTAKGIVDTIDYGTNTDIKLSMKSPDYFYDADLESPRAGFMGMSGAQMAAGLQRETNSIVQKGSASGSTDSALNAMNTMSSLLLTRLVPGEDPIILSTSTMNVTLTKNLPARIFSQPISQGDAQCKMPADWCSIAPITMNCSIPTPVSVKMISTTVNFNAWFPDNSKIANGSSIIVMDLFDQQGAPIIVNQTREPILLQIPLKLGNPPPAPKLTSASMSTEDSRVLLSYFSINVTNNDSAITVEIVPLNKSVQLLVLARYKVYPDLNTTDVTTRGWDYLQLVPASMSNMDRYYEQGISPYKVFLNNTVVKNRLGPWFIGVRQLLPDEFDQYSMSNPPPIPQPFTGRLTTNFTLLMYTSGCYFSRTGDKKWSSQGCVVDIRTSQSMTYCKCNHLTSFGGGFAVAPNTIDFAFVFANASFTQNLTIYCMEIVTAVLYILLFIWCRREDKKDIIKYGITPMADNSPRDTYLYEVIVATGMRKDAGTDSKVQFILSGDEDETDVRTLEDSQRKILRRGATDSFLMTCPGPLGPLNYMRIWHDNSGKGKNAGWYLNYVIVRDIQSREKYHFIVNQWLAVEEDDGQISRLVPVSGRDQMMDTVHLFSAKGKKGLTDDHVWFSVFARPPHSRFTRIQRLSCCLCILFTAMLANAMFYGTVDTSNSANSITIGPLSLSGQQIYISIISSVITFPINFIIAFLFKRSKRRNQQTSRVGEAVVRMREAKEASPETPYGHPIVNNQDSYGAQRYVDPLNPDVRPSTAGHVRLTEETSNKKEKKVFLLPWWCSVIAWVMLWITVALSVAFVTFYAIMFQDEKAKKWLTSLLIGFFSSVLLTQPVKVLFFALLFAFICKKPMDDDIDEEALESQDAVLQSDEAWLHTPASSRPKRKRFYEAPDPHLLQEARQRRINELKMYDILREVGLYCIYVAVALLISYDCQDPKGYLVRQNMEAAFIGGGGRGSGANSSNSLKLVHTMDDYWSWLNTTAIPSLRADNWYNYKRPVGLRGFLDDYVSRIIGYATLRQLRIKKGECSIPSQINGAIKWCTGPYSSSSEDKASYGVGWSPLPNATDNATEVSGPFEYTYRTADNMSSYPYAGRISVYGGGGYVLPLRGSRTALFQKINELKAGGWIDKYTRAIFLEFTIYNANTNLFGGATIIAELMESGGFTFYYRFEPMNLLLPVTVWRYVMYGLYAIFELFIIFFIIKEARNFWKDRRNYFTQFWSWVDLMIFSLSIGATCIYVYRYVSVNSLLNVFEKSGGNSYTNFQMMAYWNEMLMYMLGLIVFWSNIKFIKLLRFNKVMSLLGSTLKYASESLVSFSITFMLLFFAFNQYFYLTYNTQFVTFSSIVQTTMQCLQMLVGKFDFNELLTGSKMGTFMFFLYMFIVFFCLLTMFVTIINEAFAAVCDDMSKQSNDYEMLDFIIDRFKRWSGIATLQRRLAGRSVENDPTNVNNGRLLPYDNVSSNSEDMIDNFPERMDRFLNCISQVYFQQDSFDAILTGTDKTQGKNLLRNYEAEMMKKKAQHADKDAGGNAKKSSLELPRAPSRQLTDVDG